MAGLYSGSTSGYDVCFYVADNTVRLLEDNSCDVDNVGDPNAFDIRVTDGTPGGCDFDFDYDIEDDPVTIDDNGNFSKTFGALGVTFSFSGTINGNSASGTASTNTPVDCSVNWEASHQ